MTIENRESIVHGTLTAHYVVGFMFSFDNLYVALIRKLKPKWQEGKLNGVGGKLEEGETPPDCMMREFAEETGFGTNDGYWKHYLRMEGGPSDPCMKQFCVDFFCCHGNLSLLASPEAEKIEITAVRDIYPERPDMVESVPWAVGLALDALKDQRPAFAIVQYP